MSIHDIYDANRVKTGLKFSEKTDYLRSEDEYSLTANVFVVVDEILYLVSNEDQTKFSAIKVLLDENESSARACERLIYKNFGVEVEPKDIKIFTTKTVGNNIYDYWIFKTENIEFETMPDNCIRVVRDVFKEMVAKEDFIDEITEADLNVIFDDPNKVKTKKLVYKKTVI